MRILAINGSPRRSGRTADLLGAALEAAREQGAETSLLHLREYNIGFCQGCYACTKGACPQQDDMSRLLSDIYTCRADGILNGAPVFNFNLPGILVNFWNRKTGMSGYFAAREEGRLDVWLQQNRAWEAGAGIVVAGQSGGQKTVLKHVNFALLGECERVLTGVRAHSTRWDRAVRDANRLGKELVRALNRHRGPYAIWQMPMVYRRLTCFEFPRP